MLLLSSGDLWFEYAFWFSLNNEVEYEASIAGLRVERGMRVNHLLILSDSQLILNQINDEYQAKDSRIELSKQGGQFKKCVVRQVPRSENSNADALAQLASAYETNSPAWSSCKCLMSPQSTMSS